MTGEQPQFEPITEESYRQLFLAVGYAILQRLLRDIASQTLPPDQFVKYVRAYTDLAKLDVARERIRADLEIARIRADAAMAVAEKRAKSKKSDEYDEEAPYGRRKDGTPCTHDDFMDRLTVAVRDIYGVNIDMKKQAHYFRSDEYKNAPWPNDVPAHRDDEDYDDADKPRSPDHTSSVDAAPEQPPFPVPPSAQHSQLDPQHSSSDTQDSALGMLC